MATRLKLLKPWALPTIRLRLDDTHPHSATTTLISCAGPAAGPLPGDRATPATKGPWRRPIFATVVPMGPAYHTGCPHLFM